MESKLWYTSKTMWANVITVIALIIQTQFGFVIDAEAQVGMLAVINMALRIFTSTGLTVNIATPSSNSDQSGYVRIITLISIFLIATAMLCLLSGCATTTSTTSLTPSTKDSPVILAGKSLLAVKSTIATASQTIDTLCKSGTISKDKCIQAKSAYEMSKPAYDTAVDSYLLMTQGGDPAEFGRSLQRVQNIATGLLKFTVAGGAL